jgi:methylated-DNA-[protein]-cysteine S-methyltransferase
MKYQAIFAAPFGKLGITCTEEALLGIDFLPAAIRAQAARNELAREACAQLRAYLADASFRFDLPIELRGTEHQRKVWQAMSAIPSGQTRTYGEIAVQVASSPHAVGQACGSNPVPIVIPCHRVVSRSGLGGFMHSADRGAIAIKRWLLDHERR